MSKNTSSANTLFHFTDSTNSIVATLVDGFHPRFCMEKLDFMDKELFSDKENEFAIAMVCFCDIPLSEMKDHMNKYGYNAIGLSKKWGEKKGITPVMYTTKDSLSAKILNDTAKSLYNIANNSTKEIREKDYIVERDSFNSYLNIYNFMAYLKQYEGKNWHKTCFQGDNVRFYDEREWRYIPDSQNLQESIFLSKKHYLDKEKLNKFNEELAKKAQLKFTLKDINYIIVESDDKILELVEMIKSLGENIYSSDELTKLTTKILCAERVLEDF